MVIALSKKNVMLALITFTTLLLIASIVNLIVVIVMRKKSMKLSDKVDDLIKESNEISDQLDDMLRVLRSNVVCDDKPLVDVELRDACNGTDDLCNVAGDNLCDDTKDIAGNLHKTNSNLSLSKSCDGSEEVSDDENGPNSEVTNLLPYRSGCLGHVKYHLL
ncbi:hypothetical protein HL033_02900 [Neoehrlichia mikurensis]|uniref:Transmembrane protein n=1 Tax=Neoehrlichia mikurensis TaxID=89586 RepID=A0A9Q9BVD7_9RICK|nr:hypothetical protein [Neoehrlichia mikurensis]QXK91699.1 hypothetical protein IAH97_02895 [Neoehrlichia mikurensis]QXK92910.1 hypothetical protein HUN61_02890 [Neoehrlichia mikurensis]QXK93390.1 hypothetical protein HL033_02900 [Neoehrlichia mikurensis]UTO55661.1 hypothetical protein LUA82_01055 [Neoehrlichia mikurensis]UTO56581.1 hypothetical protein LUA81_01055 [Neoehrlichia mikurensis]